MSTLAVYDCMLFFRAASRPHRTRRTFELVHEGVVKLCMSPEVLAEIRDVLNRPEHQAKFPALTPAAVDAFLARYLRAASWFSSVPKVFELQRDPKDGKYVDLAVAAMAPYLVTTDRDLLDLMDGSTAVGRDFVERFPGLRILDPITFLDAIATREQDAADQP